MWKEQMLRNIFSRSARLALETREHSGWSLRSQHVAALYVQGSAASILWGWQFSPEWWIGLVQPAWTSQKSFLQKVRIGPKFGMECEGPRMVKTVAASGPQSPPAVTADETRCTGCSRPAGKGRRHGHSLQGRAPGACRDRLSLFFSGLTSQQDLLPTTGTLLSTSQGQSRKWK